ncbi:MAG: GNAT family N-acetyltransferase [Bacteroidales bacterium]
MMKKFVIHKPGTIFTMAFTTLTKPGLWVKLAETFLAPFKTGKNKSGETGGHLPVAELLSISVSPLSQSSGIGSQLVGALEEWLIRENISRYKVIVGQELTLANRFYQKNGFVLAGQVSIHGKKLSNVYIKKLDGQ